MAETVGAGCRSIKRHIERAIRYGNIELAEKLINDWSMCQE